MNMQDPFAKLQTVSDLQNDSLRDLMSHNELMNKLQECLSAMNDLMEEAGRVSGAVADHNISETSHEDIRRQLDAIGDVSDSSIIEKIQQHDTSSTSHAQLRAEVKRISGLIDSISANVESMIRTHNSSVTAHSDIRAQIAQLKAQIGDLNIANITEEIRKDLDEAIQNLTASIQRIETQVAVVNQTLQNHAQNITNLGDRINITNTKLTTIANNGASQSTDVDDVVLRIEELSRLHDIIDATDDPNAPYDFTHTLGSIIAPGKTATFSMHVTLRDGHESAEFTITKLENGENCECTFGKEAGIAQDESVTITADEGNTPGKIYAFRVDAKDTTNQLVITRVIAIRMAKPFQSGNVSIDNFPQNVEPKHKYPIRVMNLDDPGDGRFTYLLTAQSEHITFNPAEASSSPNIEMIVAEEQERDVDVRCTLTVHDSLLDTDITISEDTHVNPLPDKGSFKHTLPAFVKPNSTVQFQCYGLTAVDGTNATYKITSKPEWLTITPMSDIFSNQNIEVKVSGSAPRGTSGTVKVKSHDVNDVEFDFDLTTKVNQLPSSSAITTTLPASNVGGQVVKFRIAGGTDPDEETTTVTYTIDPGSSGLSFTKISGITPVEDVGVTLPKVASDTAKQFTITAVDSLGEKATDTKQVSTTITPIWVADPPRITAPTDGTEVPYEGFTVTWSEFTFHADISE